VPGARRPRADGDLALDLHAATSPATSRGPTATEGARSLTLRPVTEADEPFLRELYASTREDELAVVPWTAEQKGGFLGMQYLARQRHYQEAFPAAADEVVVSGGQAAGRFTVSRGPSEILVVDLALMPDFRGAGIGTALLEGLIDESVATGTPVDLHVEMFNPARRLYERLGFRAVSESPPYLRMRWSPTEKE